MTKAVLLLLVLWRITG